MADILSNLYLSYSLIWYHHHFPDKSNIFLRNACIDYLLNEIDYKMNLVIENYPIKVLKSFLYVLNNNIQYSSCENKNKLYDLILNDKVLNQIFKDDIYYKNTVLEKMENLNKLDKNSVTLVLLNILLCPKNKSFKLFTFIF